MKILFIDFLLWLLSLVNLLFYFTKKVNLLLLYGIVFLGLLSIVRISWILYDCVFRRKGNFSFYILSSLSFVLNGTNVIFLFFLFLLALGFTGSH